MRKVASKTKNQTHNCVVFEGYMEKLERMKARAKELGGEEK